MSSSYNAFDTLTVGDRRLKIARLDALTAAGHDVARLPFAMRILLENLLRREDGVVVTAADIEAVASWDPQAVPADSIQFMPARVLLQDFTGVPAIVDLAAMRDAMAQMGGDPNKINPLQPAELVIDHSVQVDEYGSSAAFLINAEKEFGRNFERYQFLRWGQNAFDNFKVVPPDTGIVHQVNLEFLGRVVMGMEVKGEWWAYPDTLVGTDSHTTMINGLGVLGWGVGGIEAEAAMLGQPVSMLVPQVVGFRLTGELAEGATATDLVLTVTQMLRNHGVVGKFVEFYGPGVASLALADRATLGNMSPEFGSTCAIFPVDAETLRYLRFTGRDAAEVALVEAYCKEQGLFHFVDSPEAVYSSTLGLDLSEVEPSLAGPKRPQDRIALGAVPTSFRKTLDELSDGHGPSPRKPQLARWEGEGGDVPATETAVVEPSRTIALFGEEFEMRDGAVVIAAITSCTNTSNPTVMCAAGLVARKARAKGLTSKPWVKTSLAPGSKVVTDYLEKAHLMEDLEALRFHLVGYGCTTCIGNSGPLPEAIAKAIEEEDLLVCSVLSGNRNFEGRIHQNVKANYLASPPLVVAYAIAGNMEVDLYNDPLGHDQDGEPVYLKDLWPTQLEIEDTVAEALQDGMFAASYAAVFEGDARWQGMDVPTGDTFDWQDDSTYVKNPPYFVDLPREPAAVTDLAGVRVLAVLGDSVTTDHISPAGAIKADSPAGRYLQANGVEPRDFNSYGSRRGNHEIMMRGTFANVRLRNQLVPGVEGGETVHLPDGEPLSIFDASIKYRDEGVPLMILAGKEYGSGSSRDWAAKGPCLLGVKAVLAESYERIHRSNLIGMGIVPLEYVEGQTAESLALSGRETYAIVGLQRVLGEGLADDRIVTVTATPTDGAPRAFQAKVRVDTPNEADYYRHGGILQYVLRELLAE